MSKNFRFWDIRVRELVRSGDSVQAEKEMMQALSNYCNTRQEVSEWVEFASEVFGSLVDVVKILCTHDSGLRGRFNFREGMSIDYAHSTPNGFYIVINYSLEDSSYSVYDRKDVVTSVVHRVGPDGTIVNEMEIGRLF